MLASSGFSNFVNLNGIKINLYFAQQKYTDLLELMNKEEHRTDLDLSYDLVLCCQFPVNNIGQNTR